MLHSIGEHGLSVDTLDLIVPGGSLARSLWTGYRTRDLRAQFEQKGISLGELEERWAALAPTFQASKVRNAEVDITISSADKIIQPDTAHELAAAFANAGNNVNLHVLPVLGHYGTIVWDAFRPR